MLIDLSHRMVPGLQVYPGDPEVTFTSAATVAADGFAVTALGLGSHSGTHVDAPSHFVDGAATLDGLDLSRFHGRARMVSVPEPPAGATIDDLDLDGVDGRTIVVIATGWSRHFGTPRYLSHPHLAPAVAHRLLELGVTAVGVDLMSPDPTGGCSTSLPFHQVFLGAGGVIYENLTNLAAIPSADFTFFGLPLRLGACDGSPVRAVALADG